MKKLVTNYIFDSSAKTIVSPDFTLLEGILLITNVTDNIIIYNFAGSGKGGSLAGTTLTLDYDTTLMDDTDDLQVFIDDDFIPDQPLSGAGDNGTVALTNAATWYQIPASGDVPTSPYVLAITVENADGVIRWAFTNSTTPSVTNGLQLTIPVAVNLAAGEVLYVGSDTAGDDVNYSTKIL